MKVLIIGRSDGNIADAMMHRMFESRNRRYTVHSPGIETLDVTDPMMILEFIALHGPYDGVVYAAAINRLSWVKDITPALLEHVYMVNVFGFIHVVATHTRIYPNHPTRYVTVVSDSARTPMRGSLLYGSSKTALTAVIRNMARELAPKQTVVGVSPTVVADTPMSDYIDGAVPEFRGWSPEQAAAYEQSNIPLGRRLDKEEVSETMLFALEGPDGLTGSIIEITGGK